MSSNNGGRGTRACAWRAWCAACKRHLAMGGRQSLWPDEIRCPLCKRWCKVLAKATVHLVGDVICPPGSGRARVQEK